ncbi:HIT family protein [Halobacteriovorax sp. CON-3]|uniref:HIT family protein n=1 Tax=Halobacteriovorax sp. CON-3 TaxID=3157710 RepID=UPI0037109FD9
MNNCIFCKILNGEADASFVYKSEKVTAFMDLNPINKGHVLVIPNEHHERFSTVNSDMVGEMFKVAQNILKAIEKSDIPCEGANLFLSDGEIAGQEVPHSHLHIAPRFTGDGHRMGFSGTDPDESSRDKLNETAKLIADKL